MAGIPQRGEAARLAEPHADGLRHAVTRQAPAVMLRLVPPQLDIVEAVDVSLQDRPPEIHLALDADAAAVGLGDWDEALGVTLGVGHAQAILDQVEDPQAPMHAGWKVILDEIDEQRRG